MSKDLAPTLSQPFCRSMSVNKTNEVLPQGAYNLLVEVTSQQQQQKQTIPYRFTHCNWYNAHSVEYYCPRELQWRWSGKRMWKLRF